MLDKINAMFEKYLLPVATKLDGNRYLNSIRETFMIMIPLLIFGAILVVITNLPFLDKVVSPEVIRTIKIFLQPGIDATISIMSLFMALGVSYNLAKFYKVPAIYGGALGISCFLTLTPLKALINGQVINGVIPVDRLGAKGIFLAIFGSILAVEIYRKIIEKDWVIKMPEGVPPTVARSFASLIPFVVTLSVFVGISIAFKYTPYDNVHDFIYLTIQKPFTQFGGGLIPTILAIFFVQFFWFFGLHGQNIINAGMDPVWHSLALENLQAYNAGMDTMHIATKPFIEIFTVGMGGSGMTLALIVALFLFAKSNHLKSIAKISAPAGIFNVNEPVIFGLPIVMNPLCLIPFVLAPVVVVTTTYLAMNFGFCPKTTGVNIPWTTPIFLNAFLATNSIKGVLLQMFNFVVVLAIWFPFIKVMDKQQLLKEAEIIKEKHLKEAQNT